MLFLALPLSVVAIYFIKDPFKVLYHYDAYLETGKPGCIMLNKDFISTETWINNYPTLQYDSYIFGNSRSVNYMIGSWKKHINSQRCYHFDAFGESLYGLEKKLEFLHAKGAHIKNALFVIDYSLLEDIHNEEGHLYVKDPHISGESKMAFQIKFLKVYLDPGFLKEYLWYLATGKVSTANEGQVLDGKLYFAGDTRHYDVAQNELYLQGIEQAIASNSDSFYKVRGPMFYKRDTTLQYSKPVIGAQQMKMLTNIKRILAENKATYKFVINPLYDQKKLNPADLAYIKELFGTDNVFDFSGINDFTQDYRNYYETSHYRPIVSDKIMDSIYSVAH